MKQTKALILYHILDITIVHHCSPPLAMSLPLIVCSCITLNVSEHQTNACTVLPLNKQLSLHYVFEIKIQENATGFVVYFISIHPSVIYTCLSCSRLTGAGPHSNSAVYH